MWPPAQPIKQKVGSDCIHPTTAAQHLVHVAFHPSSDRIQREDSLSLLKEIGRDFSAHVAIVQGVEAVCGELAWNCQVRVVWLWLES